MRGFFSALAIAWVMGAQTEEAHSAVLSYRIDTYLQNIRAGFAATTGFERVTTAGVPNNKETKPAYWQRITYPLYLHPSNNAYKKRETGLQHLQWVTLAWKTPEQYPFLLDLYLHGQSDPDDLAIRIPNLDMRKFLPPSIAPLAYTREKDSPDALRLAQLQAYFAEFSRTGKILYPLPSESQKNSMAEKERMEQSAPIAHRLNIAQRIASVTITNNCREPGLYEAEIKDSEERPMWRATFSFHTKLYNTILTQYHGLGISEQGTGIGVPKEIRKQDWRRYWDSFLPWKGLKSFPKVNINTLSLLHKGEPGRPRDTSFSGAIEVIKGEIPFEEYGRVIRNKSQFHYHGYEPLSYVRVVSDLPPPTGFEAPDSAIPPLQWWSAKENAGKVVPHHFRTFEDVQRYEVLFSEFDLNGVYIGQSELRDWEREGEEGRWSFDFRYLKDLQRYEMRHTGDDLIEIRLYSGSGNQKAINFVFGNVALAVGETTTFLLGIGVQPVIASYNFDGYHDLLPYGLAFSADGTILDHHRRDIGVEQVFIKRLDPTSYKVRLISYERILPVWEGILNSPSPPLKIRGGIEG